MADALWLDPTTMKCNNLAVQWGWRGFGIVNVLPIITPSLVTAGAAVLPGAVKIDNDDWIRRARGLADVFVIAAGEVGHPLARATIEGLNLPGPISAIRQNKEGGFLHPSGVMVESEFPKPIQVSQL